VGSKVSAGALKILETTDRQESNIRYRPRYGKEDLSSLDEAETYAALAGQGLAVSVIAARVGRETSEVARRIPLAKLPKRVKEALSSGVLPVEHAELIARVLDAALQE
jgi:ParB-like chromosome segregation protein Spo0J